MSTRINPGWIAWSLALLALCLSHSVQASTWWSCDWTYRSEINVSATGSASNYALRLELDSNDFNPAYSFSSDGNDLRLIDSDDSTELEFFLEHWDTVNRGAILNVNLPTISPASSNLYLYYGTSTHADDPTPPPAGNTTSIFTEPGWRIHTRTTTVNPSNEAEARAVFDSIDDSTGGYGCAVVDSLEGRNNQNSFSGPNGSYGWYNEVYFNVDTPGTWSFRYGADYGNGGGLYVDGQALDERWNDDLWWGLNFNHPDVLAGTITLDTGLHHLETIGFEGCCDGPINIQYQKPGSSTWLPINAANLELAGRSCPPGNITESVAPSISPTTISGNVFFDNGVSGTAHDGERSNGETGIASIAVTTVITSTGTTLMDQTNSDGRWSVCVVDEAAGSHVTVTAPMPDGYFHISENSTATNTDPQVNSTIVFTAAENTDYPDVNFGLIESPVFTSDQVISLSADTSQVIQHEYIASSTADITFDIRPLENHALNSFAYTTAIDADCNGIADQPETPISTTTSVTAGSSLCVVIHVFGTSQLENGDVIRLQIDANTNFAGIPLTDLSQNIDQILGKNHSRLQLQKQVCNQSQSICNSVTGEGFSVYNNAAPGEEVIYRLVFSTINDRVSDVLVLDSVPAFTSLKPFSVSLAQTPAGSNCTLVQPANPGLAGYTGDIEFQCSGSISPADQGIISFSVLVD